jgi:hypothetical protein
MKTRQATLLFLALAFLLAPRRVRATPADSLASGAAAAPADTTATRAAAADTAAPKIVRRFEEFVVRARLHDPRSSETVHLLPSRTLRALPVDDLTGAVALKAGVVAQAGELHVRGGRAGEMRLAVDGVTLNDPLRDRAPEIPLLAIRSASLVSGGLDAEYGGSLAGVLDVRTMDPGARWSGEALWRTDGRRGTHFDRVSARLGGPLGVLGLGVVGSADVTLDDTYLPALRSAGRTGTPLGSFGWRADNRMLAHLKLAPVEKRGGPVLEVLASRRVDRPYSPSWSLDGWTIACVDPFCTLGPGYSPTPLPGYEYYRAADHAVMTDERQVTAMLSLSLPRAHDRLSGALALTRVRSLTSLGAHDDESYLTKARAPYWGGWESPASDPFTVYAGDEPYFRKSESDAWTLRADYERWTPRGSGGKAGLGGTYHAVRLRELDVTTFNTGLDSLRSYEAFAPGAYAYAQGRWVFEGLVLNAGLRGEYFTAGPQAERQSYAEPAPGVWSLSPRLGLAYPISAGDVFSLAYVRVQQNPARDFLYDNRTIPNNYHPLGNPAIEPATVISWQAAVKHLIGERWSLQGAIFLRDVFGEVGARNFVPARRQAIFRYEDADDAHATGWELSLIRAGESALNLELHYTWMMAEGSESLEEGIPYYFRTGSRPVPIGVHPLNWDRRHSLSLAAWREWRQFSLAWSTQAGSGLPWTPASRRQLEGDLSRVNTERFHWTESSALSARWSPPRLRSHASIGLEVRNVFDFRSDASATLSGYPHFEINTIYDDYGAFRTETGLGGGAYWDDRTGDGVPGWVRMHDPRLLSPPRTVRLELGAKW